MIKKKNRVSGKVRVTFTSKNGKKISFYTKPRKPKSIRRKVIRNENR